MIKKISSRTLLIISLALHVVLTLPLVAFVTLDGTIQLQIYMHANSHFGKHDIAFIGDSITAGGFVWASKIGVWNLNVANYAKGGFTTYQVASLAKKVAQERFKFCFVTSGRNDEFVNSDGVSKSYNDYIANLTSLKNANVQPIVTLMLYCENEGLSKYVDEFNNRILAYCILNDITIIDLNKLLCCESGLKKEYSRGGVHLNNDAYSIWGREINRVLHEKGYL
ncbi:MAG: SGNH/GDSL hydrolase family protein [Syntrophobacteraceae bacterium]